MTSKIRQLLACVLAVMLIIPCFTAVAASPLTLPDLISDNMLIQRDMPIRLWGFGGNPGETLTVEIEDKKGIAVSEGTTTIGDNGFEIELPALSAGGPYTIRFLNDKGDKLANVYNVLVGELWYQGGQSNMQLAISAIPESIEERVNPKPKDDTIRLFFNGSHFSADTPAKDIEGKWVIADKNLRDYSAVGYKALETIHNELDIPVGGICTPYGGTSLGNFNSADAGIYKAKVAPVTQFNIRGVMWYQGETDRAGGVESIEAKYNQLISFLRGEWRNESLPFVIVQLHPSPMKGLVYGSTTEWEIKDFSNARVAIGNTYAGNDNVGMAVAFDCSTTKYRADGEDPSHPYIKAPVGERLGNVALSMVYGKDIDANSPLYISKSVNGNELTLKFKDTYDGLKTTDGSEPKGFMIAGGDGIYVPAKAVLSGDTVTLTSDKVANPVNASYGLEKHYWPYPGGPKDQESIDAVPDICELDINVVNSANLPVAAFDTAESIGESVGEDVQTPSEQEQTPAKPVKVDEIENTGDKTVLYVAPDGNDSNNGSIDKPFASLEKARDTIRALKSAGQLGEGGAVVYIRGGEYLVQKTFELTAEDSGTEDAPITYRNYPDEEVKLVGAAILTSDLFKKVTDEDTLERIVDKKAREKIVGVDLFALGYTSLPEQTWPGAYSYTYNMDKIHGKKTPESVASELVIDGKTMTIARYPNDDYMIIETVLEPGENVRMWHDDKKGTADYIEEADRKTTPFTITVDDERVVNWTEAKDALLYGYWFHSWADQTVPLASVKTSNRSITSKYPSVYQAKNGQHFYIYNLIEEIDIPGEYFVDRDEGMLYLYPPEGGIGTAMYTTLDKKMITITDAEYITIKGIDMGYMRNGAVTFSNTKGCELAECSVHYTGKLAVSISGYDNRMYDCHVYDCDGGVSLSGGDRATLTPGNNIVENCDFENNSRISNAYCPAVRIADCGNKILSNKIHGSDHTVFQFSGNDHVIAYNEIYDACRYADDMGAIYTGRAISQRGNKIIHNYFHDIGSPDLGSNGVHAIFLDDFWSSAEISGNVFADITGYGMMGAGSYNAINNNIFINVQKGIVNVNRSFAYGASDADANNTYFYAFRNDLAGVPWQSEIWQTKYPEMSRIKPDENQFDVGNYIQIKNNVSFNSAAIRIGEQQAATATVENNVDFGSDPGFYDLENKNYLLKPDSEVYEKNPEFEPILFTRMGNYSDRAINRIKKAYAVTADSPYTFVNGERIKSGRNGATVIEGKLYIPLRTGVEAVGGTLEFDEATNEISISTGTKQVNFTDGAKDSVSANGTEFKLANPIVNIDYTNYVSAEDIANLFEKQVDQYGKTVVLSDIENLFTETVDDGLLRYIETQLTVY